MENNEPTTLAVALHDVFWSRGKSVAISIPSFRFLKTRTNCLGLTYVIHIKLHAFHA